MSDWNYRLCKITYNKGEDIEEVSYEIRETYYNDDGRVWAITEKAVGLYGDTPEVAKECYRRFGLAFEKEVIDLDTIEYAPLKNGAGGIDEDNLTKIEEEDFDEAFSELMKKQDDKPV
jgi:hypothetical protein